jgi:hypothetical protein
MEFAADRRAAEASLPNLASALLKLLEAPSTGAFVQGSLAINPTEERIRRLTEHENGHARQRGRPTALCRPALWSVASGLATVGVIVLAVRIAPLVQGCSPAPVQ